MSSFAHNPALGSMNYPIPTFGSVPSVAASATYAGTVPLAMASPTPPMTPVPSGASSFATAAQVVLGKREGEDVVKEEGKESKKRRVAPTLVNAPGPSEP